MISSRDQRRIYLLPGKTRSVSESRLQDISTVIKQDQQSRPNVPTNPDRSCTYLVLRAHRIVQTSGRPTQNCPWWTRAVDRLDQHSRRALARGGKIKMTLESAEPKGKRLREANGKTKVGPCWRSFIQSKLSRGSHKSPNRVRNAKSRNITPV